MTTRRNLLIAATAVAATAVPLRPRLAGAADDVADFLFVQTASAMTFDKAANKLTLEGIGATTLFFSDRPERIAGNMGTTAFVPFWSKGKDSFLSDPPNAEGGWRRDAGEGLEGFRVHRHHRHAADAAFIRGRGKAWLPTRCSLLASA